MSTVETVQGPIDAAEMGVTLIHEHVRFRDEAVASTATTSCPTTSRTATPTRSPST
jgi:predicted metal-dependent phosphotriesterase family hydrolase